MNNTNNTKKTLIAVILGVLVVVTAFPAIFIVGFGGYSNSMDRNRLLGQKETLENTQKLSDVLERSHFTRVNFGYGDASKNFYVNGVLTPETLEDPTKLIEHINFLRQELDSPFFYSLEDSERKEVEFEFQEGASDEEITSELLKEAFASPGEENYDNRDRETKYTVSINTLDGEILPGPYYEAKDEFKTERKEKVRR